MAHEGDDCSPAGRRCHSAVADAAGRRCPSAMTDGVLWHVTRQVRLFGAEDRLRMDRLKRRRTVLWILGVVLLLPLVPLMFIGLQIGQPRLFLIIAGWLLLNGLIGYVGGRRGRLAIAVLGPMALVAAGLIYTSLTNPYGGLRSAPPGTYPEWWGLAIIIPMATVAFGISFVMAAMGIRIVEERGRCRSCDYLLKGLAEPRCPECGTDFDPTEVEAGGAEA
ncbi:MAG: hypothetical protein IPK83_08335 [Planctomycetes bacterium]|nr:hypothetical protein [Planctomycetota bacterium]